MAIQISQGIGGVVREVKPVSIGVGGAVRNVAQGFMGVGGTVKQIYQDGLTLYDYGQTDYALSARECYQGGGTLGVVSSDRCYISNTSRLANTYGHHDIDSTLGCPSFVISGISELNATDILKYSQLEVTYSIGSQLNSLVDDINVSFGGWAGWDWEYDTSLESKSDSYSWLCRFTHDYGTTGTFTQTVDITSTSSSVNGLYRFLRNTQYCGTSAYKEQATNFYFGAYTWIRTGSDYRDWFCSVPVSFYKIRLL